MPRKFALQMTATGGLALLGIGLFSWVPVATAVLLTFSIATGWLLMMERVVAKAVAASAVPRRGPILRPEPPTSVARAYWDG
ncbi:MAG TPA: hypothetical protein VNZ52_16385 [Candidatus Thermoplasmatota archaeon]|nr:hypothetical protein [Candidatus Thermoplasmatota archaeon]